jgi:hypothetical protein
MYSDADFDMMDLEQAARDIANGVCPRCEDWLDPKAHGSKYDLGPSQDGYHVGCLNDERR